MFNADRVTHRAHRTMLLRAVLLGLSFSAVGLMAKGLPPLLLTSLRFLIAGIAVFPLLWLADRRMPTVPEIMIYSVLGLCQAIFFGGMFWAAHRMSAVSMTILYVSVPFLTYCLGLAFRVERPSGRLLGILATGAVGALGLAWAESGAEGRSAVGGLAFGTPEGVFFAGCISLALYGVVSKWGIAQSRLPDDATARTFWSLALGCVIVGAVGFVFEEPTALARLDLSDMLRLPRRIVDRRHLLPTAACRRRAVAGGGERLLLCAAIRLHAAAVCHQPASHLVAVGAGGPASPAGDDTPATPGRRACGRTR